MAFFRQAVLMRSLHTGRATRMSAKGAAEDHGSERTWKMFSVFGAIPILIACHYQSGMFGDATIDHSKRPPFVPYEHLRIRTKVSVVTLQ